MTEKGTPLEKELPKEKALFTLTIFVLYNLFVSVYTPHIWMAFAFSVVVYLETTMLNNYLYCQTLIITNDIFMCVFVAFILYQTRWMLTQTFLLTIESETSLLQLTSIFDQIPDSVLLLRKATTDHPTHLKLNHMEILEDHVSMGEEVLKRFELVHCNGQVDKLFGTNFSLIDYAGDEDKVAFTKS